MNALERAARKCVCRRFQPPNELRGRLELVFYTWPTYTVDEEQGIRTPADERWMRCDARTRNFSTTPSRSTPFAHSLSSGSTQKAADQPSDEGLKIMNYRPLIRRACDTVCFAFYTSDPFLGRAQIFLNRNYADDRFSCLCRHKVWMSDLLVGQKAPFLQLIYIKIDAQIRLTLHGVPFHSTAHFYDRRWGLYSVFCSSRWQFVLMIIVAQRQDVENQVVKRGSIRTFS